MGQNADEKFIGIVNSGKFQILIPETNNVFLKLTRTMEIQATSPEAGEIDLSGYEGKALVVQGKGNGGWIWGANITEQGGPTLTSIVQHAVSKGCIS